MTARLTHKLFAGFITAATVSTLFLSPALAADKSMNNAPDPMQIARGAKAWPYVCNRCHNLRDPKELSDNGWTVTVTHMRVRANLPGQLARDIAAFLKANN